jgi:hypothetical protein
MKHQISVALESSTVARSLGLCAAALAGTAGVMTEAQAVVVTSTTPIVVPANSDGIYINFLNGAATTPASNPGWDFNPYLANGVLTFYWNNTAPSVSGGVSSVANGPYLDLVPGAVISNASSFSASAGGGGAAASVAFQTTGTHILGIKFYNETTAVTNYGYVTMSNNAPNGFPTTILGWGYENNGGAITVPSAVPEASTSAMLSLGALALGAVNLRRLRRQRRLQAA